MRRFIKALGASVLVCLLISPGVPDVSARAIERAPAYLDTCLASTNKLSVLMLVDESQSLKELGRGATKSPGNDPMDMRVPALTSVVRVLNSVVEASSASAQSGRQPLDVAIAVAGFGDGYALRLPFTLLNGRSVSQVTGALAGQADRDVDLKTRYDVALSESLKQFEEYSEKGADCRLLIWFSDGQHDSNNEPGYSSGEKAEIESSLCGANGIVDQLRASGVTVVAAGLNADEDELNLMRLIAAGGQGYRFTESSGRAGRVSVSVDRCGDSMPDGRFALAQDADDIVDSLFEVLNSVPGIPRPEDPLQAPGLASEDQCAAISAGAPCYVQVFTVDDSVSAFQILVERPSEAVTVVLTTAESQDLVVLNGAGASTNLAKNVVESTVVSARKAAVSVTRKKENPIQGEWRLAYYGVDAAASQSSITFVGVVQVDLVDASGAEISPQDFRIGRFEANDLGIRVRWEESASPVAPASLSLDVALEVSGDQEVVRATRMSASPVTYLIAAEDLETQLQSPALRRASAVDIVVRPSAEVAGIRLASGDPVTVDFGTFVFNASVSNGAGLPSFVSVEPVTGVEFEGTPKQKIGLVFRGPDSGDGRVTVQEFLEPEGVLNLDLIDPGQVCETPQQQTVTCAFELIPDEEAVREFVGQLRVEYSAVDSVQAPIEGLIDVPVTMYLRPRTWVAWLAAATLLAIFVLVQGLVRLGLSIMLSKFSPLTSTARRVRLPITVDHGGGVAIGAPTGELPAGDDGFAFENAESVQSFQLFGYQFECPIKRTFMKSTTVPVGLVSVPDAHVIGSQGFIRARRDGGHAVGLVALALRSQWVIGVKESEMARLVDGSGSVNAELIAYLEPYEGRPRADQISELSYSIASSSFSSQLAALLEQLRESTGVDVADDLEDGGGSASPVPAPGSGAIADDVFGTPSSSDDTADRAAVAGGRRRRKALGRHANQGDESERGESPAVDQGSTNKDNEWDPFA